jgi:hypothetical protein
VQNPNAKLSIVITDDGIVILVKPVQSINADVRILVTEFGIVTLVKLEQP